MKIGFVSLGCPKNLVDSEVMIGLVQQAGHDVTADASDAEVLVVNTCAFIDSAKQESIDAILEVAERRESGQLRSLVVAGCLPQRYGAEAHEARDELHVHEPLRDPPSLRQVSAGSTASLPAPCRSTRPSGS